MAEKFDCFVIGSGPGGYAAAIRCAQRGASIALVEKESIGGTCLNRGCIPSKALLSSAQTLLMAKRAAMMGVDVASVTANWPKMQDRKETIVAGFVRGLTGLLKSNKVKIFNGRAVVTEPNKIKIETDTKPISITADKIILATGSEPAQLSNIPFDGQTVISSKEALSLQQIPRSMVVVGGGVIGCELACIYAAIGTKVTIAGRNPRLIPKEDEWVSRLLRREFNKIGIETLTGREVISFDKTNSIAKVTLKTGQTIEAEKIFVSVGRRPTVDKETIEALNLEMTSHAIKVNERMETNVPGVYAIGDVVGTTFLAHGAFAEAKVAAVNATGGDERIADYSFIPRAVFTFPEVVSVGKSEETCKSEGIEISVGKSFFRANGRSLAHNETVGEIRVVRENSTNKIIGVTMVGATVTELIAAARLLLGSTEKVTDISFPHPTVSEVLKEAAEGAFGLSLHNPPKP